jgi:hypothetical protein
MTSMWGLVPSRGRAWKVDRLVRACALTATGDFRLHFGFDADDPQLPANITAAAGCKYDVQPRMGLAAWTNHLAAQHLDDADMLASIGDDMVPKTHGWDTMLAGAVEQTGGGFAYPQDGRRSDIPEMCVMSAGIVKALGWMALPSSSHWFIDNVWYCLGEPDLITYRPDVIIKHKHPNTPGGDPHDRTYADAAPHLDTDLAAYQRWRLFGMKRDRETVRRACSPSPAS